MCRQLLILRLKLLNVLRYDNNVRWARGALSPTELTAVTVNVYWLPLPLRSSNKMGDALPDTVVVAGSLVTLYDVIGDPPSFTGAVKEMIADAMVWFF